MGDKTTEVREGGKKTKKNQKLGKKKIKSGSALASKQKRPDLKG